MLPEYRQIGDATLLAAGLASLLVWVLRRGTVALYAGAFLTALALPGTIQALGQPLGAGWGTLFFGLAFLLVAAVRASQGGGIGWQALYGAILVLIGGARGVNPRPTGLPPPPIPPAGGLPPLFPGRPPSPFPPPRRAPEQPEGSPRRRRVRPALPR